jgi:nucleotide-binding universal stress UspA family protein
MSEKTKPYTIVVGVDYSEGSELALERAFELAASKPAAKLHVVSVLTLYRPEGTAKNELVPTLTEAGDLLRSFVSKKATAFASQHAGGELGFLRTVTAHLRTDSPTIEIAQLASDVESDLVVVGTHGRRGVSRLVLGSVAEATVRLAPCPVLVVRQKAPPQPVPAIEPPCPRCVAEREATEGREQWCAQHRERHGQRHTYHQGDRVGAETNMPLVFKS